MIDTPLTRHAGIAVPLLCGAMYPCSNPELVAAVSRPPVSRRDLLEAGVASDLLDEREQARVRLSGAGAVVVDAPVEHLASRCVSAYLQLKSTARL